MAAPIPTVPLSTPLRAQLSPTSVSRSTSFPIRAPLSSDDTGSDADTLSTADEGFETASDPDELISGPIIAARVTGMPIAQLTGEDDVDEEDDMFEDVIEDEMDGEALPAVARIPVAGDSDSSDGEVFDPQPEEPIKSEDSRGLIVGGESKLNESDTIEMANEEHMSHDEVMPDFKVIESEPETNKISDVDGANFNQLQGVESLAEDMGSRVIERETTASDVGDSELGNEVESSPIVAEGSRSKEAEGENTESGTGDLVSMEELESSPGLVEESKSMETEREIKEIPTMPVGENSIVVSEIEGKEEPQLAEEGDTSVSVGEVESSRVIVQETGGGETGSETAETSSMAADANSSVVLHEMRTSESVPGMDQKILADAPKVAADDKGLVSVQEVELPLIPSEEAEIIAHASMLTPDDSDFESVQKVESPVIPSEESKTVADMPKLAAKYIDLVSVQEFESPVIPSEESKTVTDTPELAANNTDLVSIQEVELPVMPSEELNAPELAADDTGLVSIQEVELPVMPSEESNAHEIVADNTDLVSVQEVELPVIPSEESETVAHAPELVANDTDLVSVQQIESPVMPSEESKNVADTPELAANNTDLVSVQEVELPVISSEESKTSSDAPELAADDLVSVQEVESSPILSEESGTIGRSLKLSADGTNLASFQEVKAPSIRPGESTTIAHAPVLAVNDSSLVSAVDDSGLVSVQEVESSLTPSEESKIVVHAPELAADNSSLASVQEVGSAPIPSGELEIVAHAPELPANDSGLVSVQEVDSPLIPSEESEIGTYMPELPADETDITSVCEVELPHIPSEESDTVAHASEFAAEKSDFVSIQEVESPLIPSEESEMVAHAPELVTKYNDLVSLQEVKSPLIPSEELETVTHAPVIDTDDIHELKSPVTHALVIDTDDVHEVKLPLIPSEELETVTHMPVLDIDEVQEVKSPLIPSEELETVTHAPEIVADDVQEVESPLIPSEISENVAHVPDLAANASGTVSGQDVESAPILSGESGSREDLATKYNNLVSVQEVKLPLIPSEELETVTHALEMSANNVQEVESPLNPSEISENDAHAPELVADATDSVSVKEAESLPILSEESGSKETEREITKTSNLAGDGSLSRGTEREITLTSSMTDDRTVAVVSGLTPTPESILGPEEKTACDVGGGTWSVQEGLSLPITLVAEEREGKEREREIPQTSRVTRDGNSATVSGLEEEVVADAPDLVADGGNSETIQEAETPPVLAKELQSKVTKRESVETLSTTAVGNSVLSVKTPTPESDDDVEKIDQNTLEDGEENLVSQGPSRVAILESAKTKQIIEEIIEELDEGSSSTSTHSGFGSLLKYPRNIDGQIVSDSDEDAMDIGEEGGEKELFDSAALASLLRAATGASPDGSVNITSSDGTSIFSVDRPAGLGPSVPSLKPAPPARPAQPNRPTLLDHTIVAEPERIMDDEERKLHEKFEQIRVKFLLLVQRLGHSSDDTEAAKVLYRLSLVEGIRIGRQTGQVFSFENAKKKALEYEMNGRGDLDFSCTILVLGKTGVGKSATVNSIFGKEMSRVHAFEKATTSVKEIVGIVYGVKIRVIDTPGLKASVMDQASNRQILSSIKKHTKRFPPDIVLYVDRMDIASRSFNDLPLLKSITAALGSSIWLNTVVALTHAASAPPDGPNGYPLSYDMFVAQTSRAIQHSIGQAAGDFRLMNHVALVENHPSCRRNAKGESVLPNGLCWRTHMLLLCYSIQILSEANSILKLQEPSPGKLFGFRLRSPPFAYFLASLLQSRPHPKLASAEGGDNGDSDVDLDDLIDADQEVDEDEYDELPPFKPLRNFQIAKLTREQRRAYFDEYDYRVRLLQKKQWKEELRRLNAMKRKKDGHDTFGYDDAAADFDQDNVPAIPVPLPDMSLPPSFDSDDTVYLYRSLEPTSQLVTRPVLEPHTWDHDVGYNYANIVQCLAVLGRYPAEVSVQLKKDKKDFYLHLDSSLSAKHGENASTLAGFDIQSIGKQLAYILRSDTKFKNLKKNKTGAGISITFLGETVATGLKIEDQLSVGKRVSLGARVGAVRAQGDMAYKTSLEATLRDKDYPFGQSIQTLGLSLTSWRGDLTLESDLQSQFSIGRNSKMSIHAGLNNKRSGQITIRTSSSEHPQLALVGIIPLAIALYRHIWPGDSQPY